MRINKRNLWIYAIGFLLSLVLLGLYFINPENPWCTISVSIGASGIGAVALAYFIEWSNEVTRAEIRKRRRTTMLDAVDFYVKKQLEKLVLAYFRKRELLFEKRDKATCYRISFCELWDELRVQEEYIEQEEYIGETIFPPELHAMDREILGRYESFGAHLESNIYEFIVLEAAGDFSADEIEILKKANYSIQDSCQRKGVLDTSDFEFVFSELLKIGELAHFKTMDFYYKNGRVDCISSHLSQPLNSKEFHPSEEERKNAISALEREDYPVISGKD